MKRLWIVLILFMLAVATRFVVLGRPSQVVFDEVHFGKFVTAYCCSHERFFDIHPPHAKIMIAAVGYVLGYRGGYTFEHIGAPYGDISVFALRFVPALAGAGLVLVIYWLLRELKASSTAAFIGGLLIVFDNALIVQSRLIALDTLLLLTTFTALASVLVAFRSYGWRRWGFLVLSGTCAGFATGSKFTGLMIIGLLGVVMGIHSIQEVWSNRQVWKRILVTWILGGIVVLTSAAVIYGGGWAMHFGLLNKPGSGDVWGIPRWDKPIVVSFVRETVAIHKKMLSANYNLTAKHPDQSPWWSWPLMLRPVFYWSGAGQYIYMLGNPVVWWGTTIVLLTAASVAVTDFLISEHKLHVHTRRQILWIPLVGYALAYLPFIDVPRALFLYHYFTPLIFAIVFSVLWLDQFELFKRWQVVAGVTVVLLIGFVVISPATYAFFMPQLWQDIIGHLPRWG